MSLALITMLPSLVSAGIATEQQIAALIRSFHKGLTDAEVTAILDLVKAEAARRGALAHADQLPNA